MSLGAEIALQRIAARLSREAGGAPVAVISEFGVGSPGVDAVARTARLAWRPAAAFLLAPAAVLAPPVDIAAAPRDARRILSALPIIADVAGGRIGETLALCREVAGRPPDALRAPLGSEAGDPSADGMTQAFRDVIGGEAVHLAEGVDLAGLFDGLDPGAPGFVDEFDALVRGDGAFAGLRFTASGAEAMIRPVMALDLPDERQRDHALGAARAVFDRNGSCSITAPLLSRHGGDVGILIRGADAAEAPIVDALEGVGAATAERVGRLWRIRVRAEAGGAAARLDIAFPGLAQRRRQGLEIAEIWTAARRRRAAWDDWREADAQVALEESW